MSIKMGQMVQRMFEAGICALVLFAEGSRVHVLN